MTIPDPILKLAEMTAAAVIESLVDQAHAVIESLVDHSMTVDDGRRPSNQFEADN